MSPQVLGGQCESPEPRTGVCDQSNMVKMQLQCGTCNRLGNGKCNFIYKASFYTLNLHTLN